MLWMMLQVVYVTKLSYGMFDMVLRTLVLDASETKQCRGLCVEERCPAERHRIILLAINDWQARLSVCMHVKGERLKNKFCYSVNK